MNKVGCWTASLCSEIPKQTLVRSCELWLDVFGKNIATLNDRISDDSASLNTEQFIDMFEKLPGKSIDYI